MFESPQERQQQETCRMPRIRADRASHEFARTLRETPAPVAPLLAAAAEIGAPELALLTLPLHAGLRRLATEIVEAVHERSVAAHRSAVGPAARTVGHRAQQANARGIDASAVSGAALGALRAIEAGLGEALAVITSLARVT